MKMANITIKMGSAPNPRRIVRMNDMTVFGRWLYRHHSGTGRGTEAQRVKASLAGRLAGRTNPPVPAALSSAFSMTGKMVGSGVFRGSRLD